MRKIILFTLSMLLIPLVGFADDQNKVLQDDQNGVVSIILNGDENSEAFSKISKNIEIQFFKAKTLRDSLRDARKNGNYETIDDEIMFSNEELGLPDREMINTIETYNEYMGNSPLQKSSATLESLDSIENASSVTRAGSSDCDFGRTVAVWWNHNAHRPSLTDGIETHSELIYDVNSHPYRNYVVFTDWGTETATEVYIAYDESSNSPWLCYWNWKCNYPGVNTVGGVQQLYEEVANSK